MFENDVRSEYMVSISQSNMVYIVFCTMVLKSSALICGKLIGSANFNAVGYGVDESFRSSMGFSKLRDNYTLTKKFSRNGITKF